MKYSAQQRTGFMMIELLIVVGILGILASIMLVYLNPEKQVEDARNAERTISVREQESAAMQHLIRGPGMPANNIPRGIGNALPVCRQGVSNAGCVNLDLLIPRYIPELPIDILEDDATITGYRIYLDQGNRIHLCSDYLPDDHERSCS